MAAFQRILVATDLSGASELAVSEAVRIAADSGGALFVLHVLEIEDALALSTAPEAIYRAYREGAELRLRECVPNAEGRVDVRFLIREGAAEDEILRAADEVRADLIVTGTRGRRGTARLFLGSVAARVVAQASCPVLTVRSLRKGSAKRRAPAA